MDEAQELADALAEGVRRRRTQRGWTLDEAAPRLGISRRSLTLIERGDANPSLSTLLAIAAGFEVDLVELLDATGRDDLFVGPAAPRRLWTTEAGSFAEMAAAHGPLELWTWELAPGESRDSHAHAPGSRECAHVHSGTLTVEIGDDAVAVPAGEAVSFPTDRSHRYLNAGPDPVVFALAVYDPIAGE